MSQIVKKLDRGGEVFSKSIHFASTTEEKKLLAKNAAANFSVGIHANEIVPRAETFEFKTVSFENLRDEAMTGLEFYANGFFVEPFEDFVFNANIQFKEAFDRLTIIGTTNPHTIRNIFDLNDHPNADEYFMVIINILDTVIEGNISIVLSVIAVKPQPLEDHEPAMTYIYTGDRDSDHDLIDPGLFLGLWSILNTKGVELKRRGPSREQHAALLAKGITSARPITYVGVKKYLEAKEEAARMAVKGTHASPRPHLRRGHIRERYGRKIAVRPTIVNATLGDAIKRDKYVVRHQGDQP